MSEIEMRDLKPNQDFTTDQRFLLYSWDFNNVHCLTATAKFPPVNSCKDICFPYINIRLICYIIYFVLYSSRGIGMDMDEIHR